MTPLIQGKEDQVDAGHNEALRGTPFSVLYQGGQRALRLFGEGGSGANHMPIVLSESGKKRQLSPCCRDFSLQQTFPLTAAIGFSLTLQVVSTFFYKKSFSSSQTVEVERKRALHPWCSSFVDSSFFFFFPRAVLNLQLFPTRVIPG